MTLKNVLQHSNYINSKAEYLGEGAWHQAWKLTGDQHEPLVLRIPKKFAYNKEVPYDEAALKAEYGGTDLYYRSVNQVVPGAAPEMFVYHVSVELTYTIESFAGNHVNLHTLSKDDALEMGEVIGQLYREVEQVDHGLEGLGYLTWNKERGLHGHFLSDFQEFIEDECKEVMDDYHELSLKRPIFDNPDLRDGIKKICETRLKAISHPVLTNQDASPENWLIDKGQIRLIDPLPILYFGEVMAGNFLNLYETLFVELSHTERYKKHQFNECQETLKGIADGFVKGYCAQNPDSIVILRGEQMLQVLDSAVNHVRMLEEGLNEEQIIRYGSKEDVGERLSVFHDKLIDLLKFT
ncbi:hypothetical protein [Paenisporosarcina quisquiliarum]|uniref:hypothetical protein n=1 Tax=Paenisporosarcina quisquiliarum TaxID=365346 RepID=UPI0037360153